MFVYIFPIVLIVSSNILYNISQKSTPEKASPLLALLITYMIATLVTASSLLVYRPENGIFSSIKDLNWTSFALGMAIVGLELGYLFAYRAGWNISIGSLVANISLAIALIPIGVFIYGEDFNFNKIAGVVLCLGGLFLLGSK